MVGGASRALPVRAGALHSRPCCVALPHPCSGQEIRWAQHGQQTFRFMSKHGKRQCVCHWLFTTSDCRPRTNYHIKEDADGCCLRHHLLHHENREGIVVLSQRDVLLTPTPHVYLHVARYNIFDVHGLIKFAAASTTLLVIHTLSWNVLG